MQQHSPNSIRMLDTSKWFYKLFIIQESNAQETIHIKKKTEIQNCRNEEKWEEEEIRGDTNFYLGNLLRG